MGTSLEIVIPDIGEAEEVEVVEILVQAGDHVQIDDPVVTLESDKASLDVPSTAVGRVSSIVVKPGDRVRMGSVLLIVDTDDASDTSTSQTAAPKAAPVAASVSVNEAVAGMQPTVADAKTSPPLAVTPQQSARTDTVQDVLIPDVGSDDPVEVIEIHVKAGDRVSVDDPLITLESDKASMDVPASRSGLIAEVYVHIGDQVRQGEAIVSLRIDAAPEPATDTDTGSAAPTTSAQPAPVPSTSAIAPAKPAPAVAVAAAPPANSELQRAPQSDTLLPHASPSVRRFARELGADLSQITGTGRKQRILVSDVQQWVKNRLSGERQGDAGGHGIPPVPAIDFSKFGATETVRLSRIKRLSGPHLQRAWLNAPHVTHHDEADITDMEEFRQSMKAEVAKQGIKLTPLVFILRALVAALKEFPQFNASLAPDGESLIFKKYFNIGIAVDTPEGLVVPVIRDVDIKGYLDLARELSELSQRARDGDLKPKDIQGGCISVSSLGGIGGTAFTPIINVPEVAILGVARARMQPVWDGEKFIARRMLPLDLSYDHRVIDGAEAARFTSFLVNGLGDIRRLSM